MRRLLDDKRVAYTVLVVGIVGALLAILIDPIRGYKICMDPRQLAALLVGIGIALVGAYLAFVRRRPAV